MPRLLPPLLLAITLLTLPACRPAHPAAQEPAPPALGAAPGSPAGSAGPPVVARPHGQASVRRVPGIRLVAAALEHRRAGPGGRTPRAFGFARAADTPSQAAGPRGDLPGDVELGARLGRWAGGSAGRAGRRAVVPDAGRLGRRAERIAGRPARGARSLVGEARVRLPGVSVGPGEVKGKRRPRPVVSVPDVRVYDDAVCVDPPRAHVHVGRCGVRRQPGPVTTPAHENPRRAPLAATPATPAAAPTPTPAEAEPSPTSRMIVAERPVTPPRPSPLGTILLMVVLTTAIAAATAVAFGVLR
ncbi:hypothetical protein OUY22_13895 [Nonomuraea sp. MCN248]|uniref:Uncharacterized protein n=1 Tax=Nonomuraea corallina TaxID=2989783 RepID=A0ABT4SBD8_9ACTN|nr:hypothetical protein [Nonomuraea corallina]MDA0634513.1 hypothetical protein [Nonomuraea corallina]